jgi:hypothetical protein
MKSLRGARSIVIAAFGAMIGLSAINHGIFEILQGNRSSPFPIIEAIGPEQRFWAHGAEPALTILPNFLFTGILAVSAGLATIWWSIARLHAKGSGPVFALLCLSLFLFGGGIAQIVFFIEIAVLLNLSRRSPGKLPSKAARSGTARIGGLWAWPLGIAMLAFAVALEIGIFGLFPFLSDPDAILYVCFASLWIGLAFLSLAYFCASAKDVAPGGRTRALRDD